MTKYLKREKYYTFFSQLYSTLSYFNDLTCFINLTCFNILKFKIYLEYPTNKND